MSTEIATWNMIRSKIPSFPSPTAGRENECLTKAEIQSLGGLYVSINGNYENSECVMLDSIQAQPITWVYTFSVSPTSLSFAGTGDAQSVFVTSYKKKYIGGVYSGVQEDVPWDYTATDWLNVTRPASNQLSSNPSANITESVKTGIATLIQTESGKTISINAEQATQPIIWKYTFIVSPTSLSFAAIGGTQSVTITSHKDKYIGDFYTGVRLNVGFTSSADNSWFSSTGTSVTAQENTVTSSRTGIVNYRQAERDTIIPVTVWQREAVVTGRYAISADPYEIYDSVGYSGGRRITIVSKYNEYLNGKLLSSKNIDWRLRENINGTLSESLSAYSSSRKFKYTASKVNAGEGCEIYYEKCTNDIGADFATFQVVQNQSNASAIVELTITFI